MNNPKICVVRNDQIGDVALTSPMLEGIKVIWPNSELTVISKQLTVPLLVYLTSVDHILVDYRQTQKLSFAFLLKKVVAEFKRLNFDYIFFANMDPVYVIAAKIAKIPFRIGDANQLTLKLFLTHRVAISWHDFTKHEVLQQIRLLQPFRKLNQVPDVNFNIKEELETKCYNLLSIKNSDKYIVVHPTFGKGNRGWGVDSYAEFIRLVNKHTAYKVVLTGSNQDKIISNVIMEKTNNKLINLTGKISLDELIVILKNSSCVIGAETGPLHIASLCKRPIISISPTKYTSSFRWGPFNTNHVVIKMNDNCPLVCHTYKTDCQKDYCINSITSSHVFKAFQFLMTQKTFPQNSLYYWIKTNAVIALHVDNILKENNFKEALNNIIMLFNQESIKFKITTTNKNVYEELLLTYKNIFYASKWNIIKWVHVFSATNITVWHSFSNMKLWWVNVIKKLIALNIDKEPVYVHGFNHTNSIKDLLKYYIQESQKLSDKSNEES